MVQEAPIGHRRRRTGEEAQREAGRGGFRTGAAVVVARC
ncbi:hypothetical protein Ahy_B04g070146 isoform D [Arachis hypogaea]|uniref:Uncharacterized protein n=1 Tax=Arachis hypogaea TaxID=3818 RepID=A0A444ZF53_ARAHY|nr:hypothetical protein Ahy_B04g070146 isoform D [Arachis hypogaea]